MIVDDEPASLQRLKRLIEVYDSMNVCGAFTDAHELLQAIAKTAIDIVFLDIEMPEISGLELTRIINNSHPEIAIVFVTAYDEYALHAFEVEAIDYLLKPIRKEQLERCIQRLGRRKGTSSKDSSKKGKVHCFQKFLVYGPKGEYVKFRNSKSEELLAFLIHHRGEPVSKDEIIETLWEGKEYEKAMATLYSTMYQLRKDLEPYGLDELIGQSKSGGGYYTFQLADVECDVEEFTKRLSDTKKDSSYIIDLYKGSYFEKNDYFWAQERRQQLENGFVTVLENMYQLHEEAANDLEAMEILQKLCQLRPFDEKYHEQMIGLYIKSDEMAKAQYYKETIEAMYKNELGIAVQLKI